MQNACLDYEWRCNNKVAKEATMGIVPLDGFVVDLPFCMQDSNVYFYKTINVEQYYNVLSLELFGLQGVATVYLNGHRIGTVTGAYSVVDLLNFVKLGQNAIMLHVQNTNGAAGIAGGVNILRASSVAYVDNLGIFVTTRFCSPSIAFVGCEIELIYDDTARYKLANMSNVVGDDKPNPPIACEILVEIFNYRNKRVSKRLKKMRLRKNVKIEFKKIRINKPLLYCDNTPSQYKILTSLLIDGVVVDSSNSLFGIRTFNLRKKKFALNNRVLWLNGVHCDLSNGVMGYLSTARLEQKKLEKIKSYGFNAVRVLGMPNPAFLSACDRLGVLVLVDLVDNFFADNSFDTFVFDREHQTILNQHIRLLRNHPSVIIYSIANGNPYTYGRDGGIKFAKDIIDVIKLQDSTRPVTGAVTELVPTVEELNTYSNYINGVVNNADIVKMAQLISKESDIFRYATQDFCDLLDFVCYKDLSHRYKKDLDIFENRQILGVDTQVDKLDKMDVEELEFKSNILGDFSDGAGLDLFVDNQPQYVYRQVMFGAKHKSAIATYHTQEDSNVSQGQTSWDYPSCKSEEITVDVFTSGDVVALYLNDNLVSRNLAGRLYGRKARFGVPYEPGTLKAVSYLKGVEHCITQLSSVGFPYAIQLISDKRSLNILDRRDIAFVDVKIVDANGLVVDFATRDVHLVVSQECVVVAYGNADKQFVSSQTCDNELILPVRDGRAQVVIKGLVEGKASIVAKSEGLLVGRLKLSIKSSLPKSSKIKSIF
ncbi:MAG: DUF4982 domain-containing protein [Clostridiales bacterium]|nr:DUF4982 domain-containing protein [Clostridiales bacterium]